MLGLTNSVTTIRWTFAAVLMLMWCRAAVTYSLTEELLDVAEDEELVEGKGVHPFHLCNRCVSLRYFVCLHVD